MICNYLRVSEVHLEKSRGNGANRGLPEVKPISAHERRGRKQNDLLALWTGRNKPNTSLTDDTHFLRMCCTYGGIQYDRKALSPPLSEWWKGCSPRENKNGERDRCELGCKSLHQACGCRSDTPGIQTHLERIVNGIDTVPRVMKNEFPCRDVNTNDLSHDAFA